MDELENESSEGSWDTLTYWGTRREVIICPSKIANPMRLELLLGAQYAATHFPKRFKTPDHRKTPLH